MWKPLTHPNIVLFRGVTTNPLQIVSEWVPGGDLTTYINLRPHINPVTIVSLIARLSDASPQIFISWLVSYMALTTYTLTG
jgi:serine/threonine protein kinase